MNTYKITPDAAAYNQPFMLIQLFGKVAVKFPYDVKMMGICKELGGKFNSTHKTWEISNENVAALFERLPNAIGGTWRIEKSVAKRLGLEA